MARQPVYANGRKAVLQMIDVLLSDENNIQKIRDAFQEKLDTQPAQFFQETIRPLIPNTMLDPAAHGQSADPEQQARQIREFMQAASQATASEGAPPPTLHVHVHTPSPSGPAEESTPTPTSPPSSSTFTPSPEVQPSSEPA